MKPTPQGRQGSGKSNPDPYLCCLPGWDTGRVKGLRLCMNPGRVCGLRPLRRSQQTWVQILPYNLLFELRIYFLI